MIRLIEVGPRDGLQNEATTITTETKVRLIDALSKTGVGEIEVSAFVSSKWVPQLADAVDVFQHIKRAPGVVYSALVPNEKGLDRALEAKVDKIAVFTAASETFNQKNINASIAESLRRFVPVIRRAKDAGFPVRGYVSTAFYCPYEGRVDPSAAVDVSRQLFDLGVDEVSIGDTIGKEIPEDVAAMLERFLARFPTDRIAMHFHDTYGHAIENVLRSYSMGIVAFDASVGGLGGCPYAPGAAGNIATEHVIEALRAAGAEVGIDLDKLAVARDLAAAAVGRALPRPG